MTLATTTGRTLSAAAVFLLLLAIVVSDKPGVVEAFAGHGTMVATTRTTTAAPRARGGCGVGVLGAAEDLGPSFSTSSRRSRRRRGTATALGLVSEEDVLEAVELAETLWAEALEARKTANELIDEAEAGATASAGTAKEAENIFRDKTTPVTMEELVQVDSAAKASLDATSLVNKAMDASDEAERLESEAEEALKKSEETLDQHLIDFPDSSLAD